MTDALRAPARWRLARVAGAAHRLGFFAAATLMATSAMWWSAALAARHAGRAWPWAVAPGIAHGLAMCLGFMPMFIVGFLFTAGPRWLDVEPVPPARLLPGVVAHVAGWLTALAGFAFDARLAAAGIAIAAIGWTALVLRFAQMLLRSHAEDRMHATLLLLAGTVGAVSMALGASAIATQQSQLARMATQLALWGFLTPSFVIASHRMLPFFGMNWLHRPRSNRLVTMLHGGFVWFGVALLLAGGEQLRRVAWPEAPSLGLAATHALTMGYLGSTLIAMVTRVIAGHSGRAIAIDEWAWRIYLMLQAAVVMRVLAEVWPGARLALLGAASLAWSIVCVGWASRYGLWLGRPRIDGR